MKVSVSNTTTSITCTMLSQKAVVNKIIAWRNGMSKYNITQQQKLVRAKDLRANKNIFILTGLFNWTKPLSFACLHSLCQSGQVAQDNQTIGCRFNSCHLGRWWLLLSISYTISRGPFLIATTPFHQLHCHICSAVPLRAILVWSCKDCHCMFSKFNGWTPYCKCCEGSCSSWHRNSGFQCCWCGRGPDGCVEGVGCIDTRNRGNANMRWIGTTDRHHEENIKDWFIYHE